MALIYGATVQSCWRAWAEYTVSETATTYTISFIDGGIQAMSGTYQFSVYNASGTYLSNSNITATAKLGSVTKTGKTKWTKSSVADDYMGIPFNSWVNARRWGFASGNITPDLTSYQTDCWPDYTPYMALPDDLVITKTAETQTVSLSFALSCPSWDRFNSSSGADTTYSNSTSTASKTLTIPSLEQWTLSYDANGGTNAPETQTAYAGNYITLSSDQPTREGYTFLGWARSKTASVPTYKPGITTNIASDTPITIYAVWAYGYGVNINSITSKRWSSTKAGGEDDEGKYIFITGSYTLSGTLENVGTLSAKYRKVGASDWTDATGYSPQTATKEQSESTKNVNFEIGPFGGNVDTDSTYDVMVSVVDSDNNTSSLNDYISTAFFTIDFKKGGKEVAFGTPANDDDIPPNGRFKCGMEAVFVNSSLAFKNIFNLFYPVGSVYETSLPNAIPSGETEPTVEDLANLGVTWFDPHYQWGGTWELITDRFLVGAGNLYALGAEDGSKDAVVVSHHHTTNTYHRHNLVGSKYGSNYCAGGNRSGVGANDAANTTLYTNYAGSQTAASTTVGVDGTDKNMPPYKAVYIWHRTA